jgi:hypothetical protein
MKTIIAGSRDITDYEFVAAAIAASGFDVTEVVSGGARGVDNLGELWAKRRGINPSVFKADWTKFGKAAGAIRNEFMANLPGVEALIAVRNGGKSSGTDDMVSRAKAKGLKGFVRRVGCLIDERF